MATDFMPQLQASIAEIGSHAKRAFSIGNADARFANKASRAISSRLGMLNGRAAGVLQAAALALSVVTATNIASTSATMTTQTEAAVRPGNLAAATATPRSPAPGA